MYRCTLNKLLFGALSSTVLVGMPTQATPPRTTIDLGDGRFKFALDPAIGTTPPAWLGGAMEWEYAGQAPYVRACDQDCPVDNGERMILPDEGPRPLSARLATTEVEDEHGRLFRPKRVDMKKIQAKIKAYNAKVARDFGPEPSARIPGGEMNVDDADPEPGLLFNPHEWDRLDLDGDSVVDVSAWEGDDRRHVEVGDSLTDRMDKAVVYFLGDIGLNARSCTGILVGDYWVLTAAHCAKNSSGTAWVTSLGEGATRGKVCTRGNRYTGMECANVVARYGNGDWGGTGDTGDDLVIMKIDQALGAGNYMALSTASNSTLKDHSAYHIGFPGVHADGDQNLYNFYLSSCGDLGTYDSFAGDTAQSFAPCAMEMYWDSGDVTHTSTKVIGGRYDSGPGHSGGPIYYYPYGVDNGTHYLTGILSGHTNYPYPVDYESYNGGPKIKYHRDWIISYMD